MTRTSRQWLVAGLALAVAGCQGPCEKLDLGSPRLSSGSADFSRFVAVGTSISSGYECGGLMDRHQQYGFPAIFARQIGMTVQLDGKGSFSGPAVAPPGAPPLLQLVSLNPPTIINPGGPFGLFENLTYPAPYANLGVPGAILFDYANTARYGGGAFPLVARGLGSIRDQLFARAPTFISFEYGANEVLGAASNGSSAIYGPGSPLAPASFAAFLQGATADIHTTFPAARMVIFNVPDVTSIPYFNTLRGDTLWGWLHRTIASPSPNAGLDTIEVQRLGPGDLLLLPAGPLLATGVGFTESNPLDSTLVLDESETKVIRSAISQMNASIQTAAQSSWVALADLNATLKNISDHGYDVGGVHYSGAFVVGGLFSLDGVHPTDLGHAIIANAMVDAVNARFGARVPHARLADYATATSFAARPALPEGTAKIPVVDGLRESLRQLWPWPR